MFPVPTQCPVCGLELIVTRVACRHCHTTVEGQFGLGPFARLTPEQLAFVATFVRCEGKLNRMEAELGLSYPTLRSRLQDVLRAMGVESAPAVAAEAAVVSAALRRQVLDGLERGEFDADEAMRRLKTGGGEA